jgi:nucleotide-binding universal stress UspA family protein
MMYRRILIALEGKESDEAVLACVRALARQTRSVVTLLRVITVADDGGGGLGRQFQTEIGSSGWRRKNQAEADLPKLERRLGLEGLPVETALVIGTRSQADEIVGYATENNCDLIAMASDSRPWYRRWIGGSPATGVYRKATMPTLFVSDGRRRVPVTHAAPKANTMMAIFGSADL